MLLRPAMPTILRAASRLERRIGTSVEEARGEEARKYGDLRRDAGGGNRHRLPCVLNGICVSCSPMRKVPIFGHTDEAATAWGYDFSQSHR